MHNSAPSLLALSEPQRETGLERHEVDPLLVWVNGAQRRATQTSWRPRADEGANKEGTRARGGNVAATASATRFDGDSYDGFVRAHREQFAAYLRGRLGHAAEGRGGRIGVEDTLQVALLRIYEEWPALVVERDDERDRRLYRYLRDAAGQALRDEFGRRGGRPRIVSVDFDALQARRDDLPARDLELAARAIGDVVFDLAEDIGDAREKRAMLDRGVLVAGLSALTSEEAVILIAVERFDWDQHQLADHLGISFASLRLTLHSARKVFYSLVQHAIGIDLDDEERARLAAYTAGELKGPELRRARRHVKHCKRCQAMQREQRVFGRDAAGLLVPLPIISAAGALAKRSATKLGGTLGGGVGLFASPGAAKAAAVVVGLLGLGAGTSAVLAGLAARAVDPGPAPSNYRYSSAPSSQRTPTRPSGSTTPTRHQPSRHTSTTHRKKANATTHHGSSKALNNTSSSSSSATMGPQTTTGAQGAGAQGRGAVQPPAAGSTRTGATPGASNNEFGP